MVLNMQLSFHHISYSWVVVGWKWFPVSNSQNMWPLPGFLRWAWCNHNYPYERYVGGVRTRGNMMMEKERQKEMRRCSAPSSEGREKRPWAKGCGWPMRARDGKETGSCWRNTACGPMLDFRYPELYNNKICLSHKDSFPVVPQW